MTLDAEEKGERERLLSQSIGVIRDPRQVGGMGETGLGENGGDTCSKLEGLAGDTVKEFECLLTTGVVDPDVLLLAGAKSVSSGSDVHLILACRAFARVFLFSKIRFSTSNWHFRLLSSIISSLTSSHTL